MSLASNKSLGCFELVLSQLAVGINLVTAKFLLAAQVPFVFFMQLRFLLGSVLLGLFVIWQRQPLIRNQFNHLLSRKDTLVLFWQSACGGFLFNVLMMAGLQFTTASVASITFSTFPAVLAILCWFLLKDYLSRVQMYAFAVAMVGVISINIGDHSGLSVGYMHYLGVIFILLSMLPEALFVILGKWHDCRLSPYVMTFWANTINAILFLPFTFFSMRNHSLALITEQQWWWLLAYSLSGGVIFFIFWYRGIARVTATTAALITTVTPLSTCFFAWLLLNENINMIQTFGMLCVIISIVSGSGILSLKFYRRAQKEN
jgi:drug/metabolite transporter (DMT)-like permease